MIKRILLGILSVLLPLCLAVPSFAGSYEDGIVAYDRGDHKTAFREFRKAAEQGVPSVQYYLGIMYYKGKDFLQDSVQAHMWLNLAASQGHKKAREYRDKIAVDMTKAQIAEAVALAQKWFKEHQGGDGND